MPVGSLLENAPFKPEEAATITAAFEEVLLLLRMKRGGEPKREEEIAQKVMELAQSGLLEKKRLAMETVKHVL